MPQPIALDALYLALERRYDHVSARVLLAEALVAAGLPAQGRYSAAELSRLAWVLHGLGDRVEKAAQALLELAGQAATADDEPGPDDVRLEEAEIPHFIAELVQAVADEMRARRAQSTALPD